MEHRAKRWGDSSWAIDKRLFVCRFGITYKLKFYFQQKLCLPGGTSFGHNAKLSSVLVHRYYFEQKN